MRGLPKLKVNFEYEKRQKEKPMKVPKAHTLNLGRMRKLVLLLLVELNPLNWRKSNSRGFTHYGQIYHRYQN